MSAGSAVECDPMGKGDAGSEALARGMLVGAILCAAALGVWIRKRLPEAKEWGRRGEKIPLSVPNESEYDELGAHREPRSDLRQRFATKFAEEIHMVRDMVLAEAFKRTGSFAEAIFPKMRLEIDRLLRHALAKVATTRS